MGQAAVQILEACGEWQWGALGLHLSCRVYNMFILPVLLFVAQLEEPPERAFALERWAMGKVAPGPYRWIMQDDLWHLRTLAGFPTEFGNLQEASLATREGVRVWEARDAWGARAAAPIE